MDNKKYLNEENYQKAKRKISSIALIILVIGVLIGGSLIATGIKKQNEVKNSISGNFRSSSDIQADIDKVQSQIDQIDLDIMNLKTEESKLQNEKSKIFQEDQGFSDRYYAKDEEITAKENEIALKRKEQLKLQSSLSDYNSELWIVTLGYNDTETNIKASKYIPFYMFGAFIIIASCIIAFSIFMFTKRREIMAFSAQQVMPVGKEIIDDVSPTIGNTFGEIAKGIKKGLNDADKEE